MDFKFKIYLMLILIFYIIYIKFIRIEKFNKNNDNLSLFKINYLKYVIPIKKLRAKNILILGDKKLFGTFMLLKFDFIESIIVVNDILKNNINDSRVKLIIANPLEFIEKINTNFDVIINDLKIDISENRYYLNFFTNCINKCKYYINSVIYKNNNFNLKIGNIKNYKKLSYNKINQKFINISSTLNIKNEEYSQFTNMLFDFLEIYVIKKYFKIKNNNLLFYIIKTNFYKRIYNYHKKTKIQDIDFIYDINNKQFALFLNNEIQFNSKEYYYSHYIEFIIPLLIYKPKKILILGGGDLIGAGMILKHDFVESVTLVDIDAGVIKMCNENNVMRNVSNYVLDDNRLKVIIGDAVKYIMETEETFDFIIEDMYLEITTIKQKTDYNLLKNCITKTKILSFRDDIGSNIKSITYNIADRNIYLDVKDIKYRKMISDKKKSLLGLGYDIEEINKLDDNILDNINLYVTSYFCKSVYLNNKKYKYGYELYGIIENKILLDKI